MFVPCLSFSLSISLSLSLSLSLSHSLALSHTHSISLSLCVSFCVCVSISITLSIYLSLSLARSHSHTLYLSLCVCLFLCPSLSLCFYLSLQLPVPSRSDQEAKNVFCRSDATVVLFYDHLTHSTPDEHVESIARWRESSFIILFIWWYEKSYCYFYLHFIWSTYLIITRMKVVRPVITLRLLTHADEDRKLIYKFLTFSHFLIFLG